MEIALKSMLEQVFSLKLKSDLSEDGNVCEVYFDEIGDWS